MEEEKTFVLADYLVFCLSLLISAAIGIYYAWKGRRHDNTESFLLGNRDMGVLPLTVSLIVSVISAVTILGLPAEMYSYGSQYFFNIGSGLGIILTAFIFVPLLHPLQLTSMFEYLERRFKSKSARLVGSVMEILALLLYGGTALFAPATALHGVTPFPIWSLSLALGGLVTFYTTLGGLRGVVWTDVVQAVVMIGGILAVIIQGCISVGGISEVFRLNNDGDRLHFYNFDPDLTTRHTFGGLSLGFCFGGLAFYGASQFTFQRFTAVKTLKQAKLTVFLNVPAFYLFHILLCFVGLLIFAFYRMQNCDPITSKRISSSNQILWVSQQTWSQSKELELSMSLDGYLENIRLLLPLFVLDILGIIPGLPGLFVAALTCSALSTISSVMNSVSALIWDDLLKSKLSAISDASAIMVTKVTVILAGCVIVALTFLADSFGPHIFQVSFAFLGASGGPQLGMFLLGALVPRANWIGAVSGCVAGLAMTSWIIIGSIITKPFMPVLPPNPTNGCLAYNWTSTNGIHSYNVSADENAVGITTLYERGMDVNATFASHVVDNEVFWLYRISYTWYTAIGAGTCLFVGSVISLCTSQTSVESHLILPWWTNLKRLCNRLCGRKNVVPEERQKELVGMVPDVESEVMLGEKKV